MLALEPQTRFLLRGTALLLGLLTLWWFVLLNPMLYLLKGSTAAFVDIDEHPSGDWTVRVPVPNPAPSPPAAAQQIRIDFEMPRADAITFTFSLPVFWAIMLAAPRVRTNLRPLLLGTVVIAAMQVALLLAFVQMAAREVATQVTATEDASGHWFRHVGVYLAVGVIPFIAPFVVALSLHRELHGEIFSSGWSLPHPPSAPRRDSSLHK